MPLNPNPVTDPDIRALADEAGAHGDLVQRHICRVALGLEEPVTIPEDLEDRYDGGLRDDERAEIMAIKTPEQARRVCEAAILAAR